LKLLTIIISKKISNKELIRLANNQYRYQKNKGIKEGILGFKILLTKQKITYVTLVHLEKPFDRLIAKNGQETGINFKDKHTLHKISKKQEATININSIKTVRSQNYYLLFSCKTKMPTLTKILFNFYIQKAIIFWLNKKRNN